MKVAFYFDPACPWCWITSRWLLMVSNKRRLDMDWRLFSLAYKNGELSDTNNNHLPSHRLERVMLAASKHGAKLLDLYTAFGIAHFLSGEEYSDDLIKEVLADLKLDKSLIKASEDKSLDQALIKSTEQAIKSVGQDIGVPSLVLINDKGQERGFFGPVLKELPDQDRSLKLWDSLIELAQYDGFYELKRGRDGKPDVYSTAKC